MRLPKKTKMVPPPRGSYKQRAYKIWHAMINRCQNSDCHAYVHYGGRGITVCDRWLVLANFIADMGQPPAGMELDRIDNDSGYRPDNCRWANLKTQNRNKRSARLVTAHGKTMCVTDWAEAIGIPRHILFNRLNKGYPIEQCLEPTIRGGPWSLKRKHAIQDIP